MPAVSAIFRGDDAARALVTARRSPYSVAMDERVVQAYRSYIERFDATVGPSELGQFVKHRSRLVKKLRYEEFEPKYLEYEDMAQAYQDAIERGDTINDMVVKVLREFADELFLPSPV